MCFSPQRRATFRYRNFKKWFENVNLLAFWFQNIFLATAACNFVTSELQKMVWECQFFSILTSKYTSRHSGVQFFNIWTSKMCFSPQWRAIFDFSYDSAPAALTNLLFDSPDTRTIGKTQHFATSLTFGAGKASFFWFSHYCIFFLLTLLYLLILLHLSAFHLLFNFPYCRKFTI